jgi:hypothetical protein
MIKFLISVIGCFLMLPMWAQTVSVQKQTEKIRSEQAEGFATELQGKKEAVVNSWNKFLKDIGKAKLSGGEYQTISEPALGGTIYTGGILYTTTKGNEEKTTVWLGLLGSEWKVNDIEIVNKELEQLAYQFGVKFYRDQIQLQIDEAQQAADAVEKQAQRLANENRTLNNRLANNEQQKVQLEKSLKENELEHLVLQQKIVNNKKSQDSVAQAAIQIKKVVEMHKERQRKVN